MQDGAARLLQCQLSKPDLDPTLRGVFQNAYSHLTSRIPGYAWTSGQWMTERAGGSDVSQTQTVATYAPHPQGTDPPLADASERIPLGPWSITGHKWFSSATDAAMTILLAKTGPGKGVSAFLAPTRKHGTTDLNGVRIVRLKAKMGTRPLPTAELQLTDMRAWLLGAEGQGIRAIATVLTITRVHSAVAALGYLGRGLAVARAYALVRDIGGAGGRRTPLCRNALHMRTLAEMTVEYHAMMLLTFYTVSLLGADEHRGGSPPAAASPASTSPGSSSSSSSSSRTIAPPPSQHVAPLLRVLSSLHKAYVCKHAVPLMHGCLEALGGVGYLDNVESEALNLSRLFRDLCVLAIWEGTTDVLAADMVRALRHAREGPACLAALDWFFGEDRPEAGGLWTAWTVLRARVVGEKAGETVGPEARGVCFALAEMLMAGLLAVDAGADGDVSARTMRDRFLGKKGFGDIVVGEGTLEADTAIVFGPGATTEAVNVNSKL